MNQAAVVGWPVAHSLSPRMFRLFSRETGTPIHYKALAVRPADFDGVYRESAGGSWIGWNVTLPHKVRAFELADERDASAADIGAVNVVRFREGRIIGYNSDAEGFLAPLRRRGAKVRDLRAVVLGAGGAARAVCAALRREGAAEIVVFNRTAAKVRELSKSFGVAEGSWKPERVLSAVGGADLVVNATSLGMDGKGTPLPEGVKWRRDALAYDLVYGRGGTPFLHEAAEAGAVPIDGLEMLVSQAAATWRIWFGAALAPDVVERVQKELRETLG